MPFPKNTPIELHLWILATTSKWELNNILCELVVNSIFETEESQILFLICTKLLANIKEYKQEFFNKIYSNAE